ncbi:MAG: hypothetical protein AAGC71_09400 [Pseudomonadota bacterium]
MSDPSVDADALTRAVASGDWAYVATWLHQAEQQTRCSQDRERVRALLTTCDWLRDRIEAERARVAAALRDIRIAGSAASAYDTVASL